ncbi:hypothetical protein U9M48_043637 [Paspalum notatum var. saurae]|uniref:At1g61320/AtMIF1 LRR domain-containing protein n=1 Tax=Paspalum notatum var. saurae TaxID=547442 RepID=A0AAQ3UVB9_PASNO
MDRCRSQPNHEPSDRLSKLGDRVLGNILSFLPAKEAARGALLSSRWRHVFAAVHTVALEEPESPVTDPDDNRSYSPGWASPPDPNAPPPFPSVVSAAIMARQRRRGAAPLRALRVAMEGYGRYDRVMVDQWVSYAVQQADAAEGLDLELRLYCRRLLCARYDHPEHRGHERYREPASEEEEEHLGSNSKSDDDGSVVSSDDEKDRFSYRNRWAVPPYKVPRLLFSCTELRSLSVSTCRLAPPPDAAFTLPSLVALRLSHVLDAGADVERLVAGCPRLADLTLEACDAVTALDITGAAARLRRLALRCCHSLATVAVDSSELRAFEYRGAVPDASFLAVRGGCGRVAYAKIDICGAEAASESEELTNLRKLLQLFASAKHLHLESARLGSGFDKDVPTVSLPRFTSLRRLEMRGRLPDDDDAAVGVLAAMSRIVERCPSLEALSLVFHPQRYDHDDLGYYCFSEEELLDAHHLSYNPHSVLAVPASAAIPCLRSRVKEINLVHYQGGTAQRTLAKFLLGNAPVMEKLWCEFAEGPLWTQTQLMQEIQGWVRNKSAQTHFA